MSERAWDEQYEECADRLERWADARTRRNPGGHGKAGTALLYSAADSIRTLVDGLKQHERDLAAVSPADTTEAG